MNVHILALFVSLMFAKEAPAYLIDLMHDKNPEIRKVCDNTLDIISVSTVVLFIYSIYLFLVSISLFPVLDLVFEYTTAEFPWDGSSFA